MEGYVGSIGLFSLLQTHICMDLISDNAIIFYFYSLDSGVGGRGAVSTPETWVQSRHWVLPVWSLNVLPVITWVSFGFSFSPTSQRHTGF